MKTAEQKGYEDYIKSEWLPMDKEKAFGLMMELDDWINARKDGGYDVRLLVGAIEVCKAYIKPKGRKK